SRALWRSLRGLFSVLLSVRIFLAGKVRNAFEKEAVGRITLRFDNLLRRLQESIEIATAQFRASDRALRIDQIWAYANCLAPLRFRPAFVLLLCVGKTQLIMCHGVLRIIAQRVLQRVSRAAGIVTAELQLALEHKSIHIAGVGLQDFVVQFRGFVETVFQNQKLDVVFLDLRIFWMIVVEGSVFSDGFIEFARGEIEVAEHAIAFPIIRKILLGLTQEGLDLVFLALLQEEPNISGAGNRTFGIHIDGVLEFLFRFGKAVARLIKAGPCPLSIYRPGVSLDRP